MYKILIPIFFSVLALTFLYFYQAQTFSDKQLHVVFCDVGQGDAIYIRTPGNVDILVDGGRNSKVLDCLSKHMPFWDRDIELVFATHPDADHIGGLADVIQSYRVISFNTVSASKDTSVFRNLQSLVRGKKIPYKELVAGDSFSLSDDVKIQTKWPTAGFESKDSNEYSLIQVLSYGEFDLLLTGDITYQILNTIELPIAIEVFKLPHHGSKTGVDSLTFEKIRTYLAVISAGKNNSYHHPHPSVLNLLNKYHVPYKRTDEVGSIEVITDGVNTKIIN